MIGAPFIPPWVVMSDSAVPETWADARKLILGNAPWILLLVAVERAIEGHFTQAAVALVSCFIALGVAIHWKAFEGLGKCKGRRRLAFVFIAIGAAILAMGIYMLAGQGAMTVDSNQLHVAQQQPAPEPPAPSSPAMHPLTQKEEEALQGLSEILNRKSDAVVKLSEKSISLLQPLMGGNATPLEIRDQFKEIVNALSSMETTLYREFLPANRYYKTELLAALGTTSDAIVDSPVYKYQQFVGAVGSTLNTIVDVIDAAKNPQATGQLMNLVYQKLQEFQEKAGEFKRWIEDCNARIERRKAQK